MTLYCGLPVFNLRDVLHEIDAPPSLSFEHVSSKWQCIIAPKIPLPRNSKDLLEAQFTAINYLDAGVPIRWPALSEFYKYAKTKNLSTTLEDITSNVPPNTNCKQVETTSELVDSNVCSDDARSKTANDLGGKVSERERLNESNKEDEAVTKWWEYSNTFCCVSNGWAEVQFKRPQIAMRNGWDAPGESMSTSRYHTLVNSFADVFDSSRRSHEVALPPKHEPPMPSTKTDTQLSNIVEMQYFYRKNGCDDDVQLPRFADYFVWPQWFDDKRTKFGIVSEESVIASQRGAVRRWHISDDGEFTMQAALCATQSKSECATSKSLFCDNHSNNLNSVWNCTAENANNCTENKTNLNSFDQNSANYSATNYEENVNEVQRDTAWSKLEQNKWKEEQEEEEWQEQRRQIRSLLYDWNGGQGASSVPARLVICGAKGSYDWFIHDDESNVEGVHALLDLLEMPDEALPIDKEVLPILVVSVIMSNSAYALLTPPNLPHMSITLNNSIIIEQSRVSELWLDDIAYFLHRCQHWVMQPVVYEYLASNLQDDHFVGGELIPKLIYCFDSVDKLLVSDFEKNSNDNNKKNNNTECDDNVITVSDNACITVNDIIFEEYCAIVRRRVVMSLLAIVHNENYFELGASSRASLMHLLHAKNNNTNRPEIAIIAASAMHTYWSNSGSKECANSVGRETVSVETYLCEFYWNLGKWCPKPGCVMCIPVSNNRKCSPYMYLPVIYVQHRPVFGTEKTSIDETVREYFEMKELVDRPENLYKYLRTRKQGHDTLLDELF